MLTSVVIPCHNVENTLKFQLDALLSQSGASPFEVVVVDNLSNDQTVEIAKQHSLNFQGRLQIVAADERLGINVARNKGISAASGQLVLICDGDDIVSPQWVASYESVFNAELGNPHLTLWTGPVNNHLLNPWMQPPTVAQTEPLKFRGTPYAQGCNMAFSKQTIMRLGLFNERLQRGFTEVEVVLRSEAQNLRVQWVEGAVVFYRLPPTGIKRLRRAYRYGSGTRIALRDLGLKLKDIRKPAPAAQNQIPGSGTAGIDKPNHRDFSFETFLSKTFWWVGFAVGR